MIGRASVTNGAVKVASAGSGYEGCSTFRSQTATDRDFNAPAS